MGSEGNLARACAVESLFSVCGDAVTGAGQIANCKDGASYESVGICAIHEVQNVLESRRIHHWVTAAVAK